MKLLTEEGILGEQVVINLKSLRRRKPSALQERKIFPIATGKDA